MLAILLMLMSLAFAAPAFAEGAGTTRPAAKAAPATPSPVLSEEVIVDPRVEIIGPAKITFLGGAVYYASLELTQGLPSDSDSRSDCRLLEDGVPLGPAHADFGTILQVGGGAYTHWRLGQLIFSTRDNSSPLANGRTYSLDCTRRIVASKAQVIGTGPSFSYELATSGRTIQNRRLTIRNRDAGRAVATKLTVRGAPDLTTREGILAGIIAPDMTSEEKSLAIWRFLSERVYNWHPAQVDAEVHDPVKLLNVYGYGYCDDYAQSFAALAEAAGIPARIWYLNGHVVPEAFYEGRWHMFDPDFDLVLRGPDGTVLGVEELAQDPTPLLEQAGFLGASVAAFLADAYSTTADNFYQDSLVFPAPHRVRPVLQPGDEVTFDLGPASRLREAYMPSAPHAPLAGNGTLKRTITAEGGPAEIVIPFDWPYVLVGGSFTGEGEVEISPNGVDWTPTRDFASWFAARAQASYGFVLRVKRPGPTSTLAVVFQFAPLSLPAVGPGRTTFDLEAVPVSGTALEGDAGIEITHEWEDRVEPGMYAIAASAQPAEGGVVRCTPDPVVQGGSSTCAATASAGHAFTGWSGDGNCPGTGPCVLAVNGPTSVVANFIPLASLAPRLVNLSTRMKVLTGNDVLIGGFVIGGTTGKTVVIRARGPSLAPLGVAGVLSDPVVQLFSGQTPLASNDNWQETPDVAALVASGFAPTDAREAAIYATLEPGAYTAVVSGANLATGVGLIEVFEVDRPEPTLTNLSTRGPVFTATDPMIAGFIVQGNAPRTVVVRARGPSLAGFGVAGYLVNPVLLVYSGSQPIAANDDWQTAANAQELVAAGFAPTHPLEAALLLTLPPGAYTAVVTGTGASTGVAIVEVFMP